MVSVTEAQATPVFISEQGDGRGLCDGAETRVSRLQMSLGTPVISLQVVPRQSVCFDSSQFFIIIIFALFVAFSAIDILFVMLKTNPNIKTRNVDIPRKPDFPTAAAI